MLPLRGLFVLRFCSSGIPEYLPPQGVGCAGSMIALQTPDFAIVHGVSIADRARPRSVGVALSDDTWCMLYLRYCPSCPEETLRAPDDENGVGGGHSLSRPHCPGGIPSSHRNCLIGSLTIGGVRKHCLLVLRIVTLHLDRSGQMRPAPISPLSARVSSTLCTSSLCSNT